MNDLLSNDINKKDSKKINKKELVSVEKFVVDRIKFLMEQRRMTRYKLEK